MASNHDEAKKLVVKVRNILERCDFEIVDSGVHFDLDDDGESDFETDVCAVYNGYLISIECKLGNLKNPKRDIETVKHEFGRVFSLKNSGPIHSTDLKKLTNKKLAKIKDYRHIYAFGKNFKESKNLRKNLTKEKMLLWDEETIEYFEKTSKILGEFTRNEILRDLGITIGDAPHRERAVMIKQGKTTMYVLGMHPGLLLNMAYVFRRAKKSAAAYQRIINKDRLEKLSKFLKTKDLLIANSIIIAFDKDISKKITYSKSTNELIFPTQYCSAWIIDGQHRIFSFMNSKFSYWTEEINEKFKLPVVAFTDIEDTQQTRTFVNINYYQKRIDPILFCDLAASIKDLKYELSWTSLLVKAMNERDDGPWKGMIKTSEVHTQKPINISAIARHILLTKLLGYNPENGTFSGPLYNYAEFNINEEFESDTNQIAFEKQLALLNRFFNAIKTHTESSSKSKNKWTNTEKYGLTKATSVNALLLVLKSMLDKKPKMNIDLVDYLQPIKDMRFTNKSLLKYGRGFPAYQPIANELIDKINTHKNANFSHV